MDLLENFIDDTSLTIQNVRKLVDDYSLISYYLGQELELHTKYSSPLREGDENPSFSLFYGYGNLDPNVLYFKDQIGIASGDVYEFLSKYLNAENLSKLLEQINFDLQLGLNCQETDMGLQPTIIKRVPICKGRPRIEVVSQKPTKQYIDYWFGKYEIVKYWLDYYQVKCVRDIHYIYPDYTSIVSPKTLCIGYPIGEYLKIYMPFETKEFKFRNNYPQTYVEGHIQLDWTRNDLLVISKSSKENIFFRNHWNIQAVSGKSETTYIPDFIMQQYLKHFKQVVVWLDPDEAGLRSMQYYKTMYPKIELVEFLPEVKEKDPTDIFEVHRKTFTTDLVYHMLKLRK